MSRNVQPTDRIPAALPPAAPGWVTSELLEDTLRTWQPYYDQPLTADDALEILLHVGRLFDLLEEEDGQEVRGPGASVES